MTRRKTPPRDPLLLEITAAIGAGNITIASIESSEHELVQGMCEHDGAITVNPVVDMVDTIIHEATHRMRPHWSERTVRARTRRLMAQLTYREIECLHGLLVTHATIKGRRGRRTASRRG